MRFLVCTIHTYGIGRGLCKVVWQISQSMSNSSWLAFASVCYRRIIAVRDDRSVQAVMAASDPMCIISTGRTSK